MKDNLIPRRLPTFQAAQRLFSNVIMVHEYRSADGSLIYARVRRSAAPKVLPMFRDNSGEWVKGEPPDFKNCKTKPLYRLDDIAQKPDSAVWVVEGEKCADSLARLGLVATTSGSASSAKTADWAPLKGRSVRIWPDNDSVGLKYAKDVAFRLKPLGCKVEVVDIALLQLAEKQDCFDWIQRRNETKANDIETLKRLKPEDLLPANNGAANTNTIDEGAARIYEQGDGSVVIESDTARFTVGKSGVFWEKFSDSQRMPERIKICSEIRVLAKTRNADSGAWGLLLEWKDPDHKTKRWACPRELLVGDAQALRRELAANGLEFGTAKRGVDRFEEFLSTWPIQNRATCVEKIGWCKEAFVTPRRVFAPKGAQDVVVYQSASATKPIFSTSGTLDGWKNSVAELATGNSRFVFAISAAFAGPLLRFQGSGGDSGGFNIRGTSSSGKTTALRCAASVYGSTNFVRQWRATANGLEAIAEAHNDCLLILDELAQIDPSVAGECAYLLANGTGKNRMTKALSAPPPKEWRLLFLSAGELSLSEHMLEAGRKSKAGQELRLADLPADAGMGMGVVEQLHGFNSSGELVNRLRELSAKQYGTAGEAWLEWLVSQTGSNLSERVSARVKSWVAEMAAICPSGKAARVLMRFGLVAVAGELATEAGITGWQPGEAWRACQTCARAWWSTQEWMLQREEDRILEQVRSFIEIHSSSFSDFDTAESENHIPNRLGFRRHVVPSFGEPYFEWLIFPAAWRSEVCKGWDASHVARVLLAEGCLIPSNNGDYTKGARTPLGGSVRRFYTIGPKLFDD